VALERTPLLVGDLSPAAQQALSAGPAKMMAARGLAPLPDPVDLLSVLYQLSLDDDAGLAKSARGSLDGLPDRVLEGALADPRLDGRVLDLFAEAARGKTALIDKIILNTSTADETLAELAGKVGALQVDLIAQNEQRLLRHPAIIGSMYNNLQARMSTVDRAVELAVRHSIKVPGISAWDELVSAFTGIKRRNDAKKQVEVASAKDRPEGGEIVEVPDEQADAMFAAAARGAAASEAEAEANLPISKMTVPMKIRLATLGNSFQRSVLIRDPIKMVSLAAIKAPGVNDMEAARFASNHSMPDDVIAYIASRRDWTKLYGVKLSLITNPKTPIPAAVRFLDHLREKDLRQVARSKSIPSAVAAGARKRLMNKEKRGGGGRGH